MTIGRAPGKGSDSAIESIAVFGGSENPSGDHVNGVINTLGPLNYFLKDRRIPKEREADAERILVATNKSLQDIKKIGLEKEGQRTGMIKKDFTPTESQALGTLLSTAARNFREAKAFLSSVGMDYHREIDSLNSSLDL